MKAMKDKLDVSFLENCAYDVKNEGYYDRDNIIEGIQDGLDYDQDCTLKRVRDKKGKFTIYNFESARKMIKVMITKDYEQYNKKYLRTLDEIYTQTKKNERKKMGLKILGTVTVFAFGVVLSGPVCSAIDDAKAIIVDIFDDPIKDLEFEIELHGTGKIITFDETIRPEYGHGCVVQKEDVTFSESIELYCEENGLEHLTEDAKRKYEFYRDGREKEAKEIDLKEIDKTHQKSGKSK